MEMKGGVMAVEVAPSGASSLMVAGVRRNEWKGKRIG